MDGSDLTTAKILVVDDEPANVRLLERFVALEGYTAIRSTTDAREVADLLRTYQPDLLLLDLMMPHLDGVGVLERVKEIVPGDEFLPVLVLTADASPDAARRALDAGAHDFLTKPLRHGEVVLRIRNLLTTRRLHLALAAQNRALKAIVKDRTERLLQSEKIATMGSLLAGVAHELNNPLAVLSAHTQILRERATDPAVIQRADRMRTATDRCVRVVRSFLALAREQPPERTPVVVADAIQAAAEMLAYELRTDDVELIVDVATDLPALSADPHQLHQVLVNLLANAHQAMRRHPGPRRLTVRARHDTARRLVRLQVEDTGPGMSPEVQARIFEPFFTTKAVGEGTGLGLSLCRGMIEEHGGTIDVESEPGRGTRLTVELPIDVRAAAPPVRPVVDAPSPIDRKRILVVDDEPDIAAVVAEMLESDGHAADVAPNGAVALAMIGEHAYDLVLSDTKMPVMDGEAFYDALARLDPSWPRRIIFLTGDVLSREKREFLARTGAPFLTKPCDLHDVRRLLRVVLTANPTPDAGGR